MRTTKLFAAILAAGLLFSGCRQEEDYVLPDIKIGTESLEYAEQSAGQSLDVTATRDWMVRSKPDWVAVDPDRGSASSTPQKVTVTVLDNAEYNRTGEVLFSIGLAKATVKVHQAGAKGEKSLGHGTLEDPYTVEGAVAYVNSLPADTQTTENIYIKGVISAIGEEFGSFGNATFYIKDPDGGDAAFYVYRTLYLGNKKWTSKDTQIQQGDEVIICGLVVNYKGNTPETVINKSYVYSLNGQTQGSGGGGGGTPEGTGTLEDPYNAAGANAYVNTLADNAKSDKDVYIKGKISKIANNGEFGSYGNASFYISDDGETGGEDFYCYRVLYLGNREWKSGDTQIKVGDEVVICGKVTKYVSSYGTTPETVQKEAFISSLNGTTEGGGTGGGGGGGTSTASGSGTLSDPYNAAGVNAYINGFEDNGKSDADVYVKGKISKIANNGEFGSFGNATFYISDDGKTGGTDFYCYRVLYLGNREWKEGDTQIKVGDEVVICGKVTKYVSSYGTTPETVQKEAYIYSLNGKTEGGSDNGGGDNGGGDNGGGNNDAGASGNGTLDSPYNAAGAAAAVANLTWTSTSDYQTTDEVYVKGKICKIADKGTFTEGGEYGNASFYISDDGNTAGTQFYIFRTLYLGNVKFSSGKTDIKVGDEVIVKGKLMNYKGNTPETEGNKSYLYSLNGKTE